MVRLRRMSPCTQTSPARISIPYGTIKTQKIYADYFREQQISIPYGTIKTTAPSSQGINPPRFQFLMVRLRHTYFPYFYVNSPDFNSLWYD